MECGTSSTYVSVVGESQTLFTAAYKWFKLIP